MTSTQMRAMAGELLRDSELDAFPPALYNGVVDLANQEVWSVLADLRDDRTLKRQQANIANGDSTVALAADVRQIVTVRFLGGCFLDTLNDRPAHLVSVADLYGLATNKFWTPSANQVLVARVGATLYFRPSATNGASNGCEVFYVKRAAALTLFDGTETSDLPLEFHGDVSRAAASFLEHTRGDDERAMRLVNEMDARFQASIRRWIGMTGEGA